MAGFLSSSQDLAYFIAAAFMNRMCAKWSVEPLPLILGGNSSCNYPYAPCIPPQKNTLKYCFAEPQKLLFQLCQSGSVTSSRANISMGVELAKWKHKERIAP